MSKLSGLHNQIIVAFYISHYFPAATISLSVLYCCFVYPRQPTALRV